MDNLVVDKLAEISQQLSLMNTRLERLEGQTGEIHSLVPFGRWFETFSKGLANKLSWSDSPLPIEHKEPDHSV